MSKMESKHNIGVAFHVKRSFHKKLLLEKSNDRFIVGAGGRFIVGAGGEIHSGGGGGLR